MTDRPIIFSAPMVRALLDGCKTQTRRVLRGVEAKDQLRASPFVASGVETTHGREVRPPYASGDRLWVKEAWCPDPNGVWDNIISVFYPSDRLLHAATPAERWRMPKQAQHGAVTPLFMPRWASRLTLTVTDVRVQRLQEISEDDALAEGVEYADGYAVRAEAHMGRDEGDWIAVNPPVPSFAALWNSLHGPDAWGANPWVAAITFTVDRRNIDVVQP
jgi:hypothetical protein